MIMAFADRRVQAAMLRAARRAAARRGQGANFRYHYRRCRRVPSYSFITALTDAIQAVGVYDEFWNETESWAGIMAPAEAYGAANERRRVRAIINATIDQVGTGTTEQALRGLLEAVG